MKYTGKIYIYEKLNEKKERLLKVQEMSRRKAGIEISIL